MLGISAVFCVLFCNRETAMQRDKQKKQHFGARKLTSRMTMAIHEIVCIGFPNASMLLCFDIGLRLSRISQFRNSKIQQRNEIQRKMCVKNDYSNVIWLNPLVIFDITSNDNKTKNVYFCWHCVIDFKWLMSDGFNVGLI